VQEPVGPPLGGRASRTPAWYANVYHASARRSQPRAGDEAAHRRRPVRARPRDRPDHSCAQDRLAALRS